MIIVIESLKYLTGYSLYKNHPMIENTQNRYWLLAAKLKCIGKLILL